MKPNVLNVAWMANGIVLKAAKVDLVSEESKYTVQFNISD